MGKSRWAPTLPHKQITSKKKVRKRKEGEKEEKKKKSVRSVAVTKERLEGKCHQKANAAASSSLEVFTLLDFVLFLLPSH